MEYIDEKSGLPVSSSFTEWALSQKGKATKPKPQSKAATVLDYISAPLSQPGIVFRGNLKGGAEKVRATREKIAGGGGGAKKVIFTTLGTTAVLGTGVLALGGVAGAGAVGGAARGGTLWAGKQFFSKGVVGSTARTTAVLYALYPEVVKTTFSNVPGAARVLGSTVVGGPVAGVVAGVMEGTSYLRSASGKLISTGQDIFKNLLGFYQDNKPAILGATALGATALTAKQIHDIFSNEKTQEITMPNYQTNPFQMGGGSAPLSSGGEVAPIIVDDEAPKAEPTKPTSIKNTFKPSINIAIAR